MEAEVPLRSAVTMRAQATAWERLCCVRNMGPPGGARPPVGSGRRRSLHLAVDGGPRRQVTNSKRWSMAEPVAQLVGAMHIVHD